MTDPGDRDERVDDDLAEAPEPRARTYVLAWGALAAIATATLLVSRVPLGAWNLVIAMALAALKAGVVLAVFMHFTRGRALHRIALAVAVAFLLLIVAGVLADVGTRDAASAYVGARTR